jgi:hypothetical protein
MSNFVVDVIISTLSTAVGVATFDTIGVFTNDTPITTFNVGEGKLYEDLASVSTDWGSSSNTYKLINAVFSQTPRVDKVLVYRREPAAPQTKKITKTGSFVTGNVITYNVNGIGGTVNFTTDDATTFNNLASALNSISTIISSATVSGSDIDVVGVAGATLDINLSISGGASQPNLDITTTVAGWNAGDDVLKASENYDFYWVVETSHNKNTQYALAKAGQGLNKYVAISSNEAGILTNSTSDIFSMLANKNFNRVFGIYSSTSDTEFIEGAWLGRVIKVGNGQITFAFKKLAGVTVDKLTPSQRTNILNKKANFYVENGGVPITYIGNNFANEPIEFTWDIDYFKARLTENVYSLLVSQNKVPYNDKGINLIGAIIRSVVTQMVQEGVLLGSDENGNPPVITIPTLASIPNTDKMQQIMSGFKVEARYLVAGKKVKINVSVLI